MKIDAGAELEAIHREVVRRTGDGGEVVGALLRRGYDAPVEDVWNAITDPGRLRRWFMPISGDLRAGGTFQLEGNADGEILRCQPPGLVSATFGDPSSRVELRLTSDASATVLEFDHTVPLAMAGSGAGALYVGPGWDGALLALGLYLRGEFAEDPGAAANSPQAQEFTRQSVHRWAHVIQGSGTASAEEIAAATEASLAQFAPDLAAR